MRPLISLQGAAKKMTQHLKCDYLAMPENFCAKFCTLLQQDSVHYGAVFG